ncbi:TRAP transporter small permease [Vibrio viridaestus]|uniref:TRAP transporter small permease protein n=1 Tax=Vibrio viridaestus TaxID=2487322 RepID=A0A3N9TMX1_9VIBR|nr:TRAP transporter small permease [Vibrio viridaestus]RQW64995.1 TRAP transporter small permease [Vibrio viridaestus]
MNVNSIKKPVDTVIATITVSIMSILVVCVVWQVFSRYVLNQPSTMTDEIARFSMIWVGLLGAAYTVGAKRHLAIDLFTCNLSPAKKRINQLIINLLVMTFAVSVMVVGGARLVLKVLNTHQVSPAMQLPMGYVYAVLPLAGFIIALYCALAILEALPSCQTANEKTQSNNLEENA